MWVIKFIIRGGGKEIQTFLFFVVERNQEYQETKIDLKMQKIWDYLSFLSQKIEKEKQNYPMTLLLTIILK